MTSPEAEAAFAALAAQYHGLKDERDAILGELDADGLRSAMVAVTAAFAGFMLGMERGYDLRPGYSLERLATLRREANEG